MDIADGNLTVSYTYKNLKPNVAYEMYLLAEDLDDLFDSEDTTNTIAADTARTGTGTISLSLEDTHYLVEVTLRKLYLKILQLLFICRLELMVILTRLMILLDTKT